MNCSHSLVLLPVHAVLDEIGWHLHAWLGYKLALLPGDYSFIHQVDILSLVALVSQDHAI